MVVLSDPLLRYPLDLTEKIFLECIDHNVESFSNPTWLSCQVPSKYTLQLSHVCTRWRKFVSASPRLWTYVSTNWKPELMQLYLQRSECVPLVVFIHSRCEATYTLEKWSLLEDCMHRWAYIKWDLYGNAPRVVTHKISDPPQQLPLLRHFEVSYGFIEENASWRTFKKWMDKLACASVNLRRIVWDGNSDNVPDWIGHPVSTSRWKDLREVVLGSIPVSTAVQGLASLNDSVAHVSMSLRLLPGLWDKSTEGIGPNVVELVRQGLPSTPAVSSIRHLTVTGSCSGSLPLVLLLEHLSMPRLESLSLHHSVYNSGTSPYFFWPRKALMDMLTRSRCSLRHLKLSWEHRRSFNSVATEEDTSRIDEMERQECEKCLPELLSHASIAGLETLTICTPHNVLTDAVVDLLLLPSSTTDALKHLPKLRQLLFSFGVVPTRLTLSPLKMERMIHSRLQRARIVYGTTGRRQLPAFTMAIPITREEIASWDPVLRLCEEYRDVGLCWGSALDIPLNEFRVQA